MPELQLLTAGHADAVLAFERANRTYFAASISDRGDGFYDAFAQGFDALLAEQLAGHGAFRVLVEPDGSVIGRFNLYDLRERSARLGYRVSQDVAGRGAATDGVRELCRLAAVEHRLLTISAAVSDENVASRKVLVKSGFLPVGPADPAEVGGRRGTLFRRALRAG